MSVVKIQETVTGITPETLNATIRAFEALDESAAIADDFVHALALHILHQVEALSGVEFKAQKEPAKFVKIPLS